MSRETMGPEGLLALDLETTGLDPRRDRILVAAYVEIRGGEIDLSTAEVIRFNSGKVGPSAAIHGYLGEGGAGDSEMLGLLYRAMDHTLVTYSSIDARFLAAEAERRGLRGVIEYIDILDSCLKIPSLRKIAGEKHALPLEIAAEELLGLSIKRRFHDPLEDALLAALLYLKLSRITRPGARKIRFGRRRLPFKLRGPGS